MSQKMRRFTQIIIPFSGLLLLILWFQEPSLLTAQQESVCINCPEPTKTTAPPQTPVPPTAPQPCVCCTCKSAPISITINITPPPPVIITEQTTPAIDGTQWLILLLIGLLLFLLGLLLGWLLRRWGYEDDDDDNEDLHPILRRIIRRLRAEQELVAQLRVDLQQAHRELIEKTAEVARLQGRVRALILLLREREAHYNQLLTLWKDRADEYHQQLLEALAEIERLQAEILRLTKECCGEEGNDELLEELKRLRLELLAYLEKCCHSHEHPKPKPPGPCDWICDPCPKPGTAAGLPDLHPCFSLAWGDSDQDLIETDDVEGVCITAVNPYPDVTFRNLTITATKLTDGSGQPVATMPDGTPSVYIRPSTMIQFGDLQPHGSDEAGNTREVQLISRSAKEGMYRLHITYSATVVVNNEEVGICTGKAAAAKASIS